ncbi:MAG: hypothetical protein CTY15_09310 [Methylocystis sp.]|nr:MAG: hypothetical protein CTY15_09310 [Methylocystis sp.]
MMRGQLIWDVLVGLLSGPLLSGLILLMPLAVLTGVAVVLDPSLAMYEFIPEEELLVPWAMLAILISVANVRLTLLLSKDHNPGRVFELATGRYLDDSSGELNPHGHPGKRFTEDFISYLAETEGGVAEIGEPLPEDYGWGFWVGEKDFSPLWVAFAHAGRTGDDETKTDEFLAAVTLEPPVLPWSRLTYRPDFALRDRIESRLAEFLTKNRMNFLTEIEEWVDPEPKTQHSVRF